MKFCCRCFCFPTKAYVLPVALMLAGVLSVAHAATTTTWTGGSGENWFTGVNWNNGVPTNGVDAIITNGSVVLTNQTDNLASLMISNTTLTFSNWNTTLSATNVEIRNGAKLTLPAAFTNGQMSNRVYIVCTNFVLRTGGQIDTDGRGYQSGNGPGKGQLGTYYCSGGGHGGSGGTTRRSNVPTAGGGTYDLTNAPTMPGSGGGSTGSGNGGGAVRIDASNGPVTIEGTIKANGMSAGEMGGGSGGSIYITCGTFGGNTNGLLSAKGGSGYYSDSVNYSGGGGGGRIAVIYDLAAQSGQSTPTVRFNVSEGHTPNGDIGTVYLPDSALLTTNWSNFEDVRIFGVTNCFLDALFMTNASVSFAESRFALTVTNTLMINTATLKLGSGITPTAYMQLNCGRLQLTNTSALYVYSGPTNAATTNYGGRVAVANDIVVASNSWIYPVSDGTSGGSVFFTTRNVTIAAGGGFNANGLGYYGGRGQSQNGKGPGGGYVGVDTWRGSGAGYGGKGGVGYNGPYTVGSIYPWTNAPLRPGSGGGGNGYGDGGGLVWIEAQGTVVLDGTIKANGNNGDCVPPPTDASGGGSGGGIFVIADKFRGASSGMLSAYGGNGTYIHPAAYSGGGGGGRIAVWPRVPQSNRQTILADPDRAWTNVPRIVITTNFTGTEFAGSFSVSNGWGYAGGAETGTVIRLTVMPPRGTLIMTH